MKNKFIITQNYHSAKATKYSYIKNNDFTKIYALLKILRNPYKKDTNISSYQLPPKLGTEKYKTFCGT